MSGWSPPWTSSFHPLISYGLVLAAPVGISGRFEMNSFDYGRSMARFSTWANPMADSIDVGSRAKEELRAFCVEWTREYPEYLICHRLWSAYP